MNLDLNEQTYATTRPVLTQPVVEDASNNEITLNNIELEPIAVRRHRKRVRNVYASRLKRVRRAPQETSVDAAAESSGEASEQEDAAVSRRAARKQIKEMTRYVMSDLEPEDSKQMPEASSSQDEAGLDGRESPPQTVTSNIILPSPEQASHAYLQMGSAAQT